MDRDHIICGHGRWQIVLFPMNRAAQQYDLGEVGADRRTSHHHIAAMAVRNYINATSAPEVDPVAQTTDRNFGGIVSVSVLPPEVAR